MVSTGKSNIVLQYSSGTPMNKNSSSTQQRQMEGSIRNNITKNYQDVGEDFESNLQTRFSESSSPMKSGRSFALDQNSQYSTSIGSQELFQQPRQVKMLPRDHNLTKEQLIVKVRKEMNCVMEFIAQVHDKVGNGQAGLLFAFKKINN